MKKFNEFSDEELINYIKIEHHENKKSLRFIAKELGTYVTKLTRFCVKHNVEVLSREESLKAAYQYDRVKKREIHELTQEEKLKISEGQRKRWNSLSDEQREEFRKTQSEVFSKREDKDTFSLKGAHSVRKTITEGSKLEKKIAAHLEANNIYFIPHYKGIFGTTHLEADFFLPEYSVVIEVDGPSHFVNQFNKVETKQQAADKKKNAAVLSLGGSVLRIQHTRELYKIDYYNVCKMIIEVLPFLDNELRIVNLD